MNMIFTIHARGLVHKWKQLVLMLKGQEACRGILAWRRPARWLGLIHGTETAQLWGHLGVASRELKSEKAGAMYA